MFYKTVNGYCVGWENNGYSNISNMFYDGVNFLRIHIEYFNYSRNIIIKVIATDNIDEKNGCSPVGMTIDFSMELLYDFGVDVEDIPNISKDPERFLINVIKITSDLNYWNKQLKTFLASQPTRKKTKYNTMPLNYPSTYNGAPSNYQEKRYFYDESSMSGDKEKIKSLSAQIEAKDNKIKDLEDELQELKEEIKMLKAINQEC